MPFLSLFQAQLHPQAHFTPDTSPPPMLSLQVTVPPLQQWVAQSLRSGHSISSQPFSSPLVLHWSSMGYSPSREAPALPWSIFHSPDLVIPLFPPLFPPLPVQHFCPFLNTLCQGCHHLVWGAQQCPVVDPLEPAGTGCVQRTKDCILLLDVMSKPVTLKIHLVSVSFWMWRS